MIASAGGAAVFSLSHGLASLALPLLALRAGYSGVDVGVLTAIAAVSQLLIRLVLGKLMRIFPDWTLIAAAGLLLAASNGLVVISTAVVPFVIAELLQGGARALFWTGSQTHVVRRAPSSVGALATVNFYSSTGLLFGPVLAGVLSERSPQVALGVGAGIALVSVIPPLLMDRLPPFAKPPDRPPGGIWRRPGVDAGCWAGVSAGAWRGLIGSYVPVALDQARQSSSTIGVLVSVANGASVAGSVLVGRVRRGAWLTWSYAVATLATGAATALVALLAGSVWGAGIALAVSGLGAGVLQTVGPAIATDAVHPEERGEAIAVAGTFRAGALFLAPLGTAGLIMTAPLSLAMGVMGVLIALPVVTARRLHHHVRATPEAGRGAEPGHAPVDKEMP
ncbi:MAG: MFS transporter [Actinophytocola sp.]|nr:MFS transporter [Actinophytocola sp.]